MGLALVAAVRGYKLVFTITDKQSKEKVDLLKALGAEVIVCPTAVEPDDPRSYYSVAKKLAREIPNSYYPNQYDNPMNPEAHYLTTGPEIWEDSEGKITHFVCGMGTGGTISGVGRYLKEKNPDVKIIGVDPVGSLYYEFVKTGKIGKARTYVVEGIGEDIFPSTMDFSVLDDVIQVNDEECFVVARRLVKQEGIFTGGSGGGCISGALRLAKDLSASDLVVAFLPRYRNALPQQGVQRRMDARARLRGSGNDVDRGRRDPLQEEKWQGSRVGDRPAVSNGVSRAEDHAGAGYFADSGVRRELAHRHDLRGSNFKSGAARQGSAQAGGARSDEQADAHDSE